jgi:hypothetical protein
MAQWESAWDTGSLADGSANSNFEDIVIICSAIDLTLLIHELSRSYERERSGSIGHVSGMSCDVNQ